MKKKLVYIIPIAVLFLLFFGYAAMYYEEHQELSDIPVEYDDSDSLFVPEPVLRYGFNEDSFLIYDEKVQRNENLSDILLNFGLEYKLTMLMKLNVICWNIRRATKKSNVWKIIEQLEESS